MAAEIPVIIDIEGAFQDAASRVSSAIKPLKRKIDDQGVLELKFKTTIPEEDLDKFSDEIKATAKAAEEGFVTIERSFEQLWADGKPKLDDLKSALASFKTQLNSKWNKGETGGINVESLQKGIILIEDYINQRNRAVRLTEEQYYAELQATREAERRNFIIQKEATTLAEMNAKLAAYRGTLENMDPSSFKFERVAQEAEVLANKIAEVTAQIKIMGSEAGSINKLNAILQEYNRRYNAMSETDRRGPQGHALVQSAIKVSQELDKQAKSLSQIIQEETRRVSLVNKVANRRKYEETVLKTTVKTMSVLQEQERILSERLSHATVGSSNFNSLKTRLQEVRAEIEEINRGIAGTKAETADMDVLLNKTDNRIATLVKRSGQLFALHSATRFVRNMREVTAEFELQRVALGGIIQDTVQAELLFKQIKAAAMQSPFEIKDLVSFTKQLSAYRIETDKLFDVTMRLADVSAGLGVDMERLVLAYGQVRAASVLRGQELRQFTEAGIPLVDLLAKKFSDLRGELVTTGEVFELISKRAVPFAMIEEIFNDMTDAGGIFYKMQEKQSETLYGQWQKLRDALSIMYDEMGNTAVVHDAMETLFSVSMRVFQNWRLVGGVVKAVGRQFVGLKLLSAFMPSLARNTMLAKQAQDAFNRALAASEMASRTGSAAFKRTADNAMRMAIHLEAAANTTNILKQSWHRLAASMIGGGWVGVVVTAVTALIGYLVSARQEAQRLGKELAENIGKGNTQIMQAERNFKRLADAAVNAADGSYEQREALKELNRAYSDMVPSEDLQIKKLREMKGDYEALTAAIKQKIEMQVHEQNVNQITDTFGTKVGMATKTLEKALKKQGFSVEEAARIVKNIKDAIDKGQIDIAKGIVAGPINEAIKDALGTYNYNAGNILMNNNALYDLVRAYSALGEELDNENRRFKELNNDLGKYNDNLKEIREQVKKVLEGFTLKDVGTFEYNEASWKQAVKAYREGLISAFKDANKDIDISDAFSGDLIDFEKIFKKVRVGEGTDKLKKFVEAIQKEYINIAPQEATTKIVTEAAKNFAKDVGVSMTSIQQYLKQDSEAMEDYAKRVKESVENQQNAIKKLKFEQENWTFGANYIRPTDEQISNENKELDFLNKLLELVAGFLKATKTSGGASYQEDPFIGLMKERMKFMQDFKKGYDDLSKYLGANDALFKQSEIMLNRGLSLGVDAAEQKRAAKDLSAWYKDAMDEAFKAAQKYGAGSDMGAFLARQIEGKTNKDKALKAFQSLIQSLYDAQTDLDTSTLKKALEDSLKRLSDEIKRSETARNFYQDILGLTGDEQLAASFTVSVYSDTGDQLAEQIREQLKQAYQIDPQLVREAGENLDEIQQKIAEAMTAGDYGKLEPYLKYVVEASRSAATDIVRNWQKASDEQIKTWLKELEKAKTYSEKRVELAKKTAQRISEINASTQPQSVKDSLIKQYMEKEAKETAKLQYEAFKDSPMYVAMFDNLDKVSMRVLENMAERLKKVKASWKDLDPTQLKELQSRMDELNNQMAKKNPFKVIIEGIKEYSELVKSKSRNVAEEEAEATQKALDAAKEELEVKTKAYEVAKKEYDLKKKAEKATKEEKDSARQLYDLAKSQLDAQQEAVNVAEAAANAAADGALQYSNILQLISKGIDGLGEWLGYLNDIKEATNDILSVAASDDFRDLLGGLGEDLSETLSGAMKTAQGVLSIVSGDIVGGITATIAGLAKTTTSTMKFIGKISMYNMRKQIEKQQESVEELERSYRLLEDAIADAFSSDYVALYNQQIEVLEAQLAAYTRQLEEAQSANPSTAKERKERDAATKEAQSNIDEVNRSIKDLKKSFAETLTGSDITRAAQEFASAWIEAYKVFGDTTGAIKEKFKEMIDNMVTNSLAAQLAKKALGPVFQIIDDMREEAFTPQEIAAVAKLGAERTKLLNEWLSNLMAELSAVGVNMRGTGSSLSGISKDIAGASEESILGLAAGINTQNYYMSFVPTISSNVAAIVGLLGGTAVDGQQPSAAATATATPFGDEIFRGQMSRIDENLAEVRSMLKSVITPKAASTTTHVVAIK